MTDAALAPVRIVRGLGGNGSTFLSRAFAALPGVLILNECNPRSASLFEYRLNPLRQIEQAEPDLAIALKGLDYDYNELGSSRLFGTFVDDVIARIHPARTLVLRDYNIADFVISPLIWEGAKKSSLDAALGLRARLQIVLVRDPTDQFLSLRAHRALRRGMTFRHFLEGLIRMMDAFPGVQVFQYEALFAAFEEQFSRICAALEIDRKAGNLELGAANPLSAGNARGRETTIPERAERKHDAYARLNSHAGVRTLLTEARVKTGYPEI